MAYACPRSCTRRSCRRRGRVFRARAAGVPGAEEYDDAGSRSGVGDDLTCDEIFATTSRATGSSSSRRYDSRSLR